MDFQLQLTDANWQMEPVFPIGDPQSAIRNGDGVRVTLAGTWYLPCSYNRATFMP
jgi:hypothetical protein